MQKMKEKLCYKKTWKEPQKNTNLIYVKIYDRIQNLIKTRLAELKRTSDIIKEVFKTR